MQARKAARSQHERLFDGGQIGHSPFFLNITSSQQFLVWVAVSMVKIERFSFESLIMVFAMSLTRRATCKRAQFSCVVTSEDMTQIYGFGYNGTAKGFSHDDCKADLPGGCGCVHAEQNA